MTQASKLNQLRNKEPSFPQVALYLSVISKCQTIAVEQIAESNRVKTRRLTKQGCNGRSWQQTELRPKNISANTKALEPQQLSSPMSSTLSLVE